MNENFIKITGKDVKLNQIYLSKLVLEVTEACKLRCEYCGYGELNEGSPWHGKFMIEKACNFVHLSIS
jgi:2-iminoacetate synthase ThiH